MASDEDRHLDITLISYCRLLKVHPLFPYFLEKHLAIPTLLFSFTSKEFLCYLLIFQVNFFTNPTSGALYEDLAV